MDEPLTGEKPGFVSILGKMQHGSIFPQYLNLILCCLAHEFQKSKRVRRLQRTIWTSANHGAGLSHVRIPPASKKSSFCDGQCKSWLVDRSYHTNRLRSPRIPSSELAPWHLYTTIWTYNGGFGGLDQSEEWHEVFAFAFYNGFRKLFRNLAALQTKDFVTMPGGQ